MTDESETPAFDREFLDPRHRFKTIGTGSVGGKARGLAGAGHILETRLDRAAFRRVEIGIPSLTVLCSNTFDEFVERNGLGRLLDSGEPDDAIARAFQHADLPASVVGDLRAIVEQTHLPLAVRSSSRLEDDLSQPFAGVYQTKMIPNNQPSADERFRRLLEAVKFVYASTFFREARAYLAAAGREGERDSMSVIVQEVVGRRFGDRFYPHVSGVARSFNYYPSGHAAPADGVVSLALGLGKTIVDGGVCWTYSPAWPKSPPPFASAADLAAGTQSGFWAVNLGKPPEYDPIRETEYLVQPSLVEAENDGTLRLTASTFDAESGRVRMGTGTPGPRVLDFAMLLSLGDVPLNDIVRHLLRICEEETGAPVEIEFAMTFDPDRFGLLQVRPMMVSADIVEVGESDPARILVGSDRVLGNGFIETIRDVVYVRPTEAGTIDTRAVARELEEINRRMVGQQRPYLLIGFGRWGSSDPSLGIPVVWSDIAGARVIVEAMTPAMNVEPSQGSHFFHNLTAFHVPYFTVPLQRRRAIDWEWLDARPASSETRLVRCVGVPPLEVRVDGRSGNGVILKKADSADE